jgi:hypothetical protein
LVAAASVAALVVVVLAAVEPLAVGKAGLCKSNVKFQFITFVNND